MKQILRLNGHLWVRSGYSLYDRRFDELSKRVRAVFTGRFRDQLANQALDQIQGAFRNYHLTFDLLLDGKAE